MWPEVLTCLSGMKRATWSLVSQYAQVLDYDGRRLLLGFPSAGLVSQFSRGAHQEFLRQALIEVLGLDCRLEAVSDGAAGRQQARAAATPAVDDIPPPEAPPDDEEPPETSTPPPAEPGAQTGAQSGAKAPSAAKAAQAPAQVVLPADPPAASRRRGTQPPALVVDDEPSPDDPEFEGSGLVGPLLVEQLLGGQVIEERTD